MPAWKVLFIMALAAACLGLALATVAVPLALTPAEGRWLWLAGLVAATACMGTLFTLYLRRADRSYAEDTGRRGR